MAKSIRSKINQRRPSMQVTVENLILAHTGKKGLDNFYKAVNNGGYFHLSLDNGDGWLPFHINVITKNIVNLTHFGKDKWGDSFRDCDIEFLVNTDHYFNHAFGNWCPYSHENMFSYVKLLYMDEGQYSRQLGGVKSLANTWAKNLRYQGWENATIKHYEYS